MRNTDAVGDLEELRDHGLVLCGGLKDLEYLYLCLSSKKRDWEDSDCGNGKYRSGRRGGGGGDEVRRRASESYLVP